MLILSVQEIDQTPQDKIATYVKAILDPRGNYVPMLNCLAPDLSLYEHLKPSTSSLHSSFSKTQYFFALNLRENMAVLPRLLGSTIEVIQFLGPEHCALSIVEGNSHDGTGDVLAALEPHLDAGLRVHFTLGSQIDPLGGARFAKLAELRNLALSPMLEDPKRYGDATVVFLNDVIICPDDILELIHQRVNIGADMACAMDWIVGSDDIVFYDVYISRGISGDLFFDIPKDASWSRATNLFWNDKESKQRFDAKKPLQVFSCWNGAVVFTAKPFVEKKLAFRRAYQQSGECSNGEPELFCKDMWLNGHGKIAVVPYINLVYKPEDGERIKYEKGYTLERKRPADPTQDQIVWKPPPEKVKCMPTFDRQYWTPWNDVDRSKVA